MKRAGLKQVSFEALIKEVRIKSLVSGDKAMRIVLEVDSPSDKLISGINELHRADRQIAVGFVEVKDG
jgi:hypothetical protein